MVSCACPASVKNIGREGCGEGLQFQGSQSAHHYYPLMECDMAVVLPPGNCRTPGCELDHVNLSDADARVFLKEKMGWDVTLKLPTSRDRSQRWIYTPPCVHPYRTKSFFSLRTALEEHNRRLSQSLPDAVRERVTVGLLKDVGRQVSSSVKKRHKSMENTFSGRGYKRHRVTAEVEESDQDKEVIPESDPAVLGKAFRARLEELSSPVLNLQELEPYKQPNGDDSSFSELKVVLSRDEVRDFLREAGWQVTFVTRKSSPCGRGDWYYKAPANASYKQITFPSLFGAVREYNKRVRFQNTTNTEQKPTIHLKNGPDFSEAGQVVTVRTRITEKKKKLSPRRNSRASPASGQEIPVCSEAEKADGSGEDIGSPPTNRTEEQTEEVTTSCGGVESEVVKIFGTFSQDIAETDREYILHVHILHFTKDQVRISVDKKKLIVSATYYSESAHNKVFMTNAGDLRSSLSPPDDAMLNLVTATQLQPGTLRLTIPKCAPAERSIEIPIG
ncbi:hypothetical protein R1sor_024582 [Riccia sorocarpa]|uniref:SHSP domain-containing protein n=1 Tax=Riccia sorocarpa TaxID=122646 RepID=A0ABD3GUZ9_9MARC